jgi:hypothetical protein
MANPLLKGNQIRMFLIDSKKTGREPDLSGRFNLNEVLFFVAAWKTKSRRTGQEFFKGLLHIDGERGKNVGSICIYKNQFYIEGLDKLPIFYGRLKVQGNEYKVHLWLKTRDNKKPFYSGIIRTIAIS